MPRRADVLLLVGDQRKREIKHWSKWLKAVPVIQRKFRSWNEEFNPFEWNEAASVAVLAIAASKAGYLAHTEYVTSKRHETRGKPFRHGRCDLWVADVETQLSWAFEFKQQSAASKLRPGTFNKRLARACRDARAVDRSEADSRVGCLILASGNNAASDRGLVDHFDNLCTAADVAFRIGHTSPVWLAFTVVD